MSLLCLSLGLFNLIMTEPTEEDPAGDFFIMGSFLGVLFLHYLHVVK